MNRNFRKKAFEKLVKKAMILTKIVEETLYPQKVKHEFKTVGKAGPGTVILTSKDAVKPDGTVDIVLAIRGVPGANKYAERLGINSAVVTAEAGGLGSAKLEKAFGSAAWVNKAVDATIANLQKSFPDKKIKRGKLIISGFSGGGGAIARIMTQQNQIKGGVDGVIINDGLHSKPGSAGMEALVDFAKEAQKNPNKKFKLLHTAIVPWSKELGRYTSTTETADYILKQLGIERQKAKYMNEYGFRPTSYARDGGVEITAMYDKSAPYYEDNRPGSLGDQHVQALKKGYPYLLRDVL